MNPREHIGFAELSRFAGSVLRCFPRRASIIYHNSETKIEFSF